MERLVLISLNDKITKKDLNYSNFAVKKYEQINHSPDFDSSANYSLKDMVYKYEMQIILKAVERYGSIRKAAEALGVTPSTISRKISAYHLEKNKK
jgi:transcriptional regulator with PAS, ATPase and Fis domain